MTVTVREALELSALKDARPQVLAGSTGLGRPVRWVHVAELPDIAYLLNGGELLLTTGMGLGHGTAAQRRYVTEVADAGIAGLVIELGRNFQEIPPVMVQVAERHGLPLIALHDEARYVDVTEQVHRAIISHQYELLSRAEAIGRDFTDLVLGGAEISQIVHHLARTLRNPVVLEDAAHQVIDVAGQPAREGALLSGWEEHSRTGHRETDRGRVHQADGEPRCLWAGIWLRQETWGRLHVIEADGALDEITELVLDRAGAALGLALLSQHDAAQLADRAASALVTDLAAGRHGPAPEFLRRARSLGADLTRGRLAALVVEPADLAEIGERFAHAEADRQRLRLRIAHEVSRAARENECAALVGLRGDQVLAIVAVARAHPPAQALEAIVEAASGRLTATGPSLPIHAGASRVVPPDALRGALEEAAEALAFGRGTRAARTVHHFADLGTYHLLRHLAQGPELARFVEAELSPLLEHDARTPAKLVPTLRSYLHHVGHKAATADALHIQRRTLYSRLTRIEKILHTDLGSQDARTRLTLALQGLDLLRDMAQARGASLPAV